MTIGVATIAGRTDVMTVVGMITDGTSAGRRGATTSGATIGVATIANRTGAMTAVVTIDSGTTGGRTGATTSVRTPAGMTSGAAVAAGATTDARMRLGVAAIPDEGESDASSR
ncbi:hypothetical protein [Brevibacterium daeguense]|uniref:hypothetical protein n=1 Tax=Brevibacterium daeguense TaxID=909936 RepID=UPI001F31B107|nr:hypothetical protein [Brevibacterium daeguense]